MVTISSAQRKMLLRAKAFETTELGNLVADASMEYNHSLAWITANRTAECLLRRGLIVLDGEMVSVSALGHQVLETR